jgi:hypothetical protein
VPARYSASFILRDSARNPRDGVARACDLSSLNDRLHFPVTTPALKSDSVRFHLRVNLLLPLPPPRSQPASSLRLVASPASSLPASFGRPMRPPVFLIAPPLSPSHPLGGLTLSGLSYFDVGRRDPRLSSYRSRLAPSLPLIIGSSPPPPPLPLSPRRRLNESHSFDPPSFFAL